MEKKEKTILWIASGCAVLAISGVCLTGALLAYFGMTDELPIAGGDHPVFPDPTKPDSPFVPDPSPVTQADAPLDTSPRVVTATVTSVEGAGPVQVGAACGFAVERFAREGGYWCRAQIVCGGLHLYGGPRSGYFPCTVYEQPRRHVVGQDGDTSATDTDAAIDLDTMRGVLTIRDDAQGPHGAYVVRARVESVQ